MIASADPWKGIQKSKAGHLTARQGGLVWYALDDIGCPHLLIPAGDGASVAELFATRGVTAEIAELDLNHGLRGKWIDVVCVDPATRGPFALLASDIVEGLGRSEGPPHDAVIDVLERWRWFWSSRPNLKPLSDKAALGLFAELWFLRFWIRSPAAVRWWRGPLGDRHDFVHPSISIEVKATTVIGDGAVTHNITHIDQLADPGSGNLMLFSFAATLDELATYSLTALIDDMDSWMRDTAYSQLWRKRLHQAGWSPAHADGYIHTYRVVQERLYRVDQGFPRIVRRSFVGGNPPGGVSDITYRVIPGFVEMTHTIAAEASSAWNILRPLCGPRFKRFRPLI